MEMFSVVDLYSSIITLQGKVKCIVQMKAVVTLIRLSNYQSGDCKKTKLPSSVK